MSVILQEIDSDNRCLRLSVLRDMTAIHMMHFEEELKLLLQDRSLLKNNWDVLELDLRKIRFVDSKGLNVMVMLLKHVESLGKKMRARILPGHMERLMKFTRLESRIEVISG